MIYYRTLNVLKTLLILLAVSFFILTENVLAQESQLKPISCFDDGIYRFQSVSVVLRTQDTTLGKSFSEGESIDFSGYVKNENQYPIVNGNIYARISSSNDNWTTEGFNIVDEFFIAENISINANSQAPVSFSWKVPENIHSDEYRVDYYFSVDKSFNLGGLSFTNEITAGDIKFKVENDNDKIFYLDRTSTKVNNEKYAHIGGWPYLNSDSPFIAEQPIKNISGEKIDVEVTYELFYWDSIKNENLIDTKKETISIDAQSEFILRYENSNLDTSVGYLKITAESKGVKSIINIRFSTELSDTRLNYAAVNKFPLDKGEAFKVFTCAYNTVGETEDNVISLTLKDKKGEVIASGEYKTGLTTSIDGYAIDLVANDNYQFLTLETAVKDSNGNILTSYTADYDCSVLNSERCVEEIIEEYDYSIVLYTALVTIILLLIIVAVFVARKTKTKSRTLVSILLIGLVISSSYLISNLVYRTNVVTADVISVEGTYKQAKPISMNNNVGLSDRWLAKNLWIERNLQGIIYTLDNEFDPNNANIGDVFYIGVSDTCTFFGTEGVWNTPYCDEELPLTDSSNGNHGKVIMSNVPWVPSINFDSSKVECSRIQMASHSALYECTIKGSGRFDISTTIAGGDTTMTACVAIGGDKELRVSNNNFSNNYPYCSTTNPTPATAEDLLISFDRVPNSNTRWLDGTTFTWNINVLVPNPINGQCNATTTSQSYLTTAPAESLRCTTGVQSNLRNPSYVGGSYKWDCLQQHNGVSELNCTTQPVAPINGQCNTTTTSQSYLTTAPAESARCTSGIQSNLRNPSYVGGSYIWDCLQQYNGVSKLGCTTQPVAPIPGQCGSADGKYYPAQSNINLSNRCANGTTPTTITSNGDGTFGWDCQGLYYPTGSRVDDQCDTIRDPFVGGDASLSCEFIFPNDTDPLVLSVPTEVITKSRPIYNLGEVDVSGFEYKFVKEDIYENEELIFIPDNGLIATGGNFNLWKTSDFLDFNLNKHGVYQIKAYLKYFNRENVASAICDGNFGKVVATLNIPEISFSIDPELANEENECIAQVEIPSRDDQNNETEPITCEIVTESGEFITDLDLSNGYDADINVTAGTSYRLKCRISDPDYGDTITDSGVFDTRLNSPLDRCVVNPSLRQN